MNEQLGNLNEIQSLKNKILQTLLTDDYLMRLVEDKPDVVIPALDIRYKQVFPWKFTMGITTETLSFITMDITGEARTDVQGHRHPAIKDLWVNIYLFCHENIMPVDDEVASRLQVGENVRGARLDLMAARIDELLNGAELTSFGRLELSSYDSVNPVAKHYPGMCLTYATTNANRIGGRL